MARARSYDITVFGATGFTGKYVCRELLKETAEGDATVAIAGRNSKKLNDVLNWLARSLDLSETQRNDVGVIVADTDDESSLDGMCKQSKIILNCAGPYKFLGEPVVLACLAAATDYVDITGEPEFMERIRQKYHEEAIAKGIYIVNACGFDCIPSEMGVLFAKDKFDGTLTSIENYFTMGEGPHGSTANYGTYASMIHSFSDFVDIQKHMKKFPFCGPKLKAKGIHYDERSASYAVPFGGADLPVVQRTQNYFFEKEEEIPVQFTMYSKMSLFKIMANSFLFLIWIILSQFSWGTNMLLKYPEFFSAGSFSRKGPTEEQMATCYFNFVMYCKGYKRKIVADEMASLANESPDSQMVVKIAGPEIGYVLTPIVMVQSAICIIEERSALPSSGGIYTPGIAFKKTRLTENIQKHNISFEILSQ